MRTRILVVVFLLGTLCSCTTLVVQGAVPRCSAGDEVSDELILEAQSVPTAHLLPCLTEIPPNWTVTEFRVRDGETSIVLAHGAAGGEAHATLTEDCNTSDATEEFSGKEDTRLFVTISSAGEDALIATHYYTFAGGCVTYSFDLRGAGTGALYAEAQSALGFTPRTSVEEGVESETDFEFQ